MFRFVNFLITLLFLAILTVGGYWYFTTPQPIKISDQMTYAIETSLFKIQQMQFKGEETIQTWRDLAREGNSAAQLRHAQLLFEAAKHNPNAYSEAFATLRSLAEKGIPEGQNALGVLVRDGLGGITPDKIEAYKWFSLAAQRGSKLAQQNALQLSHSMTTSQMYEAESRASNWTLAYLNADKTKEPETVH